MRRKRLKINNNLMKISCIDNFINKNNMNFGNSFLIIVKVQTLSHNQNVSKDKNQQHKIYK